MIADSYTLHLTKVKGKKRRRKQTNNLVKLRLAFIDD
jgi:hypothetical protein